MHNVSALNECAVALYVSPFCNINLFASLHFGIDTRGSIVCVSGNSNCLSSILKLHTLMQLLLQMYTWQDGNPGAYLLEQTIV